MELDEVRQDYESIEWKDWKAGCTSQIQIHAKYANEIEASSCPQLPKAETKAPVQTRLTNDDKG